MTTTDTDALAARIRDEVYGTWVSCCCDGAVIDIVEAAEIAADLTPIIAAEVRKAQADALREAAGPEWGNANTLWSGPRVRAKITRRADQIEKED